MVKKIGIGLLLVIVLIAGGVFYLFSNLNDLVRTAVEEAGTRATGVAVTLGEVDIDVTGGSGALGNLNVANPSGYKTDYVFNLGDIAVSLDLNSIQSNPVVIKEIVVTAPKVIYELGDGGSNVDVIQKNVENFTQQLSGGGSGGGSGSGGSSAGGDETKVVIDNLYIRGAEVSVSAGFLDGKKLGTSLPEIHLTDIGKDSGGASPGEVAGQVIDELTKGIQGAVAGLNLEDLEKAAGQAVEEATKAVEGAASEAAKAVEGVGGGAGEAAGDALKGATEGVKNLFGGD